MTPAQIAKSIIQILSRDFDTNSAAFFEKTTDVNEYVLRLMALMRDAVGLDHRSIVLSYPNFYSDFLNIIQFRIPVHSTLHLRELAELRAQLVVRDLARYRIEFDHEFAPNSRAQFRYGIVVKQLTMDPETRALFGYLPPAGRKDSAVPYVFVLSNSMDKEFYSEIISTGARVVVLPSALSDIVTVIRAHDLDYLFFANDVSAKYSIASKLAFFKLARTSGVCVSTIMPVMSRYLRDFFAGDYFLKNCDLSEYAVEILGGQHPGFSFRQSAFDAGVTGTVPIVNADRPITFMSGSNFWKISGDVIRLWAEVVRAVPFSTIKLSLFPPHYATNNVESIVRRILEIFNENGVDAGRVEFLAAAKSSAGWFSQVGSADIYLDSFPYSSLTSIHDAIHCGVPTVVLKGPYLRNCHAPAILNLIGVDALIAHSREDYVQKCQSLATDAQSRARIRLAFAANRGRLSDSARYFDLFISAVQS